MMTRTCSLMLPTLVVLSLPWVLLADDREPLSLTTDVQQRCLEVLRSGLRGEEFWPAMHAAEGLTLGGYGAEVLEFLASKLPEETDDQKRCGLSRELMRAGDRSQALVMLDILAGPEPHGHVHAAESLYKLVEIGDGRVMRHRFETTDNLRLKLMIAGALGQCGHPGGMSFLREMLNHEDPELYKVAAWILGVIGDASDIPRLRKNLLRPAEPLTQAYHHHALALLGDAEGLAALGVNLRSEDPLVRTYAANFAGDAWGVEFVDPLIAMLEDPYLDARYRAAQALLTMARSVPPDRTEDISRLLYEATDQHPRYTEGSILELNDGSLLYAVTEFVAGASDFAQARIIARRSPDGGRTWSEPIVLKENTGKQNVMSVTLRRLRSRPEPGVIAMFYLEKNGYDNLDCLVRFSQDEARTFGPPVTVTTEPGYHVVNNDRVTQLSSGRLLVPAASTPDVRENGHFISRCFLSDDGGQNWRAGQGHVDLPKRGAMEPEVLELKDGRVLMIIRTQLGFIAQSISNDGGETWSEPESMGIRAPEAPATIRRIPATGDLVLIWNDTYAAGEGHGGKRTPLTVARSSDDGQTWQTVDNLESDPSKTFAYTSLVFVQDRAVFSYWESGPRPGQLSSRFRSVPVRWLCR